MSVEFTEEELEEFDEITMLASSPNQLDRIRGRLGISRFRTEHGDAKCDAIFAEIERREEEDNG